MAMEALATILPFVWALPLLVAAIQLYTTRGCTVGPLVLLALALSILAGVLVPKLAVEYIFKYSIGGTITVPC